MGRTSPADLWSLASRYEVATAYVDVLGRRHRATPEVMLAVLRTLGASVETLRDVPEALRVREAALWRQVIPPVAVAWNGRARSLDLRLPAGADRRVVCRLYLEEGGDRRWEVDPARLPVRRSARIDGKPFRSLGLAIPGMLPPGYHRLQVSAGGAIHETLIIAAPPWAYAPEPGDPASRTWGVFLPLYALHTARSWGCGDVTDLEQLIEWVAGAGGGVVATLPLLAAYLDEPFEPSPYVPVSRLFWNELYVDPARSPDLERCPEARALLAGGALRRAAAALRAAPLVDYRRVMALKRQVLEALSRCFFAEPSGRREDFARFATGDREDYARFRAAVERRRTPWPAWPERARRGVLHAGDYDEAARRYHLYVQWLAHEQWSELAARARRHGPGLYLDLPLGVHPGGYDAWREREVFAAGVAGGAPPDAFFTRGQNWGFVPLHPERLRAQGHRYFIACIRHHLRYAGVLRIDHVMGLHRLFWIPEGHQAREGVYVRYPAAELYAILALESHRHQAVIVGEDLGTVPPEVRRERARRRIRRMYVVPFEASPRRRGVLTPVPAGAMASLNTHDMPTFTAFWEGRDIADRVAMGLLDHRAAEGERAARKRLTQALATALARAGSPGGSRAVLRALLAWLGRSPAGIVIVNLEDLWAETEPQNVPGTGPERPNWRRRARYSLEEFRDREEVLQALEALQEARKHA